MQQYVSWIVTMCIVYSSPKMKVYGVLVSVIH